MKNWNQVCESYENLTELPPERMEQALGDLEIPVAISNHAGAFLCNHVFYCARHELEIERRAIPCGFVHVPRLCDDASKDCAGFTLDTMVDAIEGCLECLYAQAIQVHPAGSLLLLNPAYQSLR